VVGVANFCNPVDWCFVEREKKNFLDQNESPVTDKQFKTLKFLLELLIFGVDLAILAIGITSRGDIGYIVDGLALLLFILLGIASISTDKQ
jgi:hypothetical protein